MTVYMKHPDLPDAEPAKTTQAAFDKVWSDKGWSLVEPTEVRPERSKPEPTVSATPVRHQAPPRADQTPEV